MKKPFRSTLGHAVLLILCLLNGVQSVLAAPPEMGQRPNVIVVLTDDQGWGDISLHGNPNIQTPNIDSLARDGVQLKNFYVCAVCSPTRAEFLTGRYHSRMGVFSTSSGGERIAADERTIADAFGEAGYRTGAFGKWHSGMQAPYHPNARGFDEFYGFCSGHWGNYFSPMLEHNGKIVKGDGFIIDDLTNHAIEFIRDNQAKPFFVYLPLNTPHSPMQVPEEDWQPFAEREITPDPEEANSKKENVKHTRAALALVKNIDDNMGRLLASLDEMNLADNTLVLFFCDNGPNGSRFNGGLRGRKGAVHEGGLRSPCLVRLPGSIDSGSAVTDISGAVDLFPTLAEIAGVDVGTTKGPLDGVSLAGQMTSSATASVDDKASPASRRLIFTTWNGKFSIRSQRFRYHADGTLYEIAEDFGEQNDVAGEYPDVTQRLAKQLKRYIAEVNPRRTSSKTTEAFPVGHPEFPWTQLPARDATVTGEIKRSNKFPNSSYFTNWIRSEDEIRWSVDVLESGTFAVTMAYACQSNAIGSQLRISFQEGSDNDGQGKQTLAETSVEDATDSSVIGKQFDRVPRVEGYDKDWAMMDFGEISLPQGPGTLVLTAPTVQGNAGVELRLLMLERKGNEVSQ